MDTISKIPRPYNDIWMDCVTNNLIAMLISENESFKDIACYMDAIYLKKVYDQAYSSVEIQGELLEKGAYFPKIEYSLTLLDDLIEKKYEKINSKNIHMIIKANIDDGFSAFITVDRFFYPSGVNANISHMFHPTFIFGYNEKNKCYLAIEDCIVSGKLDYYSIPFDSIELSLDYMLNNGISIWAQFCKTKECASTYRHVVQIPQIIGSLERSLQGAKIYKVNYDLYYHSGLDALSVFLVELDHLFINLKDENLYSIRMLSFAQIHKRNQKLTRLIGELLQLDVSSIEAMYSQLEYKWEIFKNTGYYQLEKRKINNKNNNTDKLHPHLKNIVELERCAMENLLLLCRSK